MKLEAGLVLIKGGGDIATGVAHRLFTSGFKIVMTELEAPLVVRRTVSFAEAVYQGQKEVEGITGVKIDHASEVIETCKTGKIPVLVDPGLSSLNQLKPQVLIDATMQKKAAAIDKNFAQVVIGLGPSFEAKKNVDAVVETARGHHLGKAIYHGKAMENTGIPGEVAGYTVERVLRAPEQGKFLVNVSIGDYVEAEDVVGEVAGVPVKAKIDGIVRGLLMNGQKVKKEMKIGDIDPRASREHCFTISDKARAIGGGVLEAILHFLAKNEEIR